MSTQEQSSNVQVSVVSPVYLGEQALPELVRRIEAELQKAGRSFEIVLVEDGSPDKSWEVMQEICAQNPNVKGVRLSRNFGQHYALTAGLSVTRGERVMVMDCDLQDNPAYIPDLLAKADEGFDIVFTRKVAREHAGMKDVLSRLFHWAVNLLVRQKDQQTDSHVGNYVCMSRRVVKAFLQMKDCHRHFLPILRWLGFRATYMEIQHDKRVYGETSYTFRKLVREAITGITSQSDKLLYVSVVIGLGIFVAAMIGAAIVLAQVVFGDGYREGWASVFVLILAATGMIMMSLGVLGIYVGKVFEQSKGRPLFIIEEFLNAEVDGTAREAAEREAEVVAD